MTDIRLHHIFYDDATEAACPAGMIPLDNRRGPRDWYEFHPILSYLRANSLEDDVWYGFVSPKFFNKAGVTMAEVRALIEGAPGAEVALFSHTWAELAYSLNPWEQGERWHPGVIARAEEFHRAAGIDVDLGALATDMNAAVFSNYVIAKRRYWEAWREIAEAYAGFVAAAGPAGPHSRMTIHRGAPYAMKTFVQERFPSLVLTDGEWRVIRPDYAARPAFMSFLPDDAATRARLLRCDAAKAAARRGEAGALGDYRAALAEIDATLPRQGLKARVKSVLRKLSRG